MKQKGSTCYKKVSLTQEINVSHCKMMTNQRKILQKLFSLIIDKKKKKIFY